MTDVLKVTVRDQTGTRQVRRLRKAGQTPAILYGHGEENVNLALPTPEIETALRQGTKVIDLTGGVSQKALIRAVQWDAFGSYILHVDLTRVSESERVTVAVPLDLRGEAIGIKNNGQVEQAMFQLDVECSAGSIPDKLTVNLTQLDVGSTITAGDIELPSGVTLITAADSLVAGCHAQISSDEADEETVAPSPSEPEIIGRKPDEDGEETS